MKELNQFEIKQVNGGFVFLATFPAIGKGIGWGIAAGSALFGVALAAASYYKKP